MVIFKQINLNMKNLRLFFLLLIISSCSSDNDSQNNLPPEEENITTQPRDLHASMWFFDKEVYTLTNGDVIEVLPEQCRSESWFEIANNLVSANYNFIDDGNGNCVIDNTINDHFYFYFIGDGFFSITHFTPNEPTDKVTEYEIILENNGINDEPHHKNVMIWTDNSPEELYQGESLSSVQLFYKRRR